MSPLKVFWMSLFGHTKGFAILLVAGGGAAAWLVSRDFTTEDELVATLRRKNNNQSYMPNATGEKKFAELMKQVKDPNESKIFDDLLKRGASGRAIPMKVAVKPPAIPGETSEKGERKEGGGATGEEELKILKAAPKKT